MAIVFILNSAKRQEEIRRIPLEPRYSTLPNTRIE